VSMPKSRIRGIPSILAASSGLYKSACFAIE
jgi:hypothetical protein